MSEGFVIRGKPLGKKCYGSVPHLPGSRRGPADKGVDEGQARIATLKPRDRHDVIYVQEKLDGSNVGVARVGGRIVPLVRAGYEALSSRFEQHQLFAAWVFERMDWFAFLAEGQRICGEWLAQAHGTRYTLTHDPFVAFDLMTGDRRLSFADFEKTVPAEITRPRLLYFGAPLSIEHAMELLGPTGHHGAIDKPEGCVWRIERRGVVDFLCKYVRPDKVDGCYLPELSGKAPIWNWRPARAVAADIMPRDRDEPGPNAS